jgi:hypothetical protein
MPLKLNRTLYTVNADMNTKAAVDSPTLQGTPTAPTPSVGDNSAKVATTEFVAASASNLLRVTTFTSSGTWTKQSDVSKILIYVVGGGGGGAQNGLTAGTGGTSSFGSHCSASGGAGGNANDSGGVGGIGSGGDSNLSGHQGGDCYMVSASTSSTNTKDYDGHGTGGISFFPPYGCGGTGGIGNSSGPGGGSGGVSIKVINASNLNTSETITIGAGGSRGGTYTTYNLIPKLGNSGIVIIYEYGY